MTSEAGVLTILGELRAVIMDLTIQNRELQAKLDSLETEYNEYRKQHPAPISVDEYMARKRKEES